MCVSNSCSGCKDCGQAPPRLAGLKGDNGAPIAMRTTSIPEGPDCEFGGVLVEFAKDLDSSGVYIHANKVSEFKLCNLSGDDGLHGRGYAVFVQATEPTNTDVDTNYVQAGIKGFGEANNGIENSGLLKPGDVWIKP